MNEIRLQIETGEGSQIVTLDGKLSVGRTTQADLALPDAGLSRVHATFEQHGDDVWIFDENSTNGTFVNDAKIPPDGKQIRHGDSVTLGNHTRIQLSVQSPKPETPKSKVQSPKPETPKPKAQSAPPVLLWAGFGTMAIILLAILAVVGVRLYENNQARNSTPKAKIPQSEDIPIAVIDPLKGDPDDLDELISSWEVQEDMDASNIDDVKAKKPEIVDPNNNSGAGGGESVDLNVTRAFWEEQKAKAFAARTGSTGITPAGLQVPKELFGDGVIKQKAKLAEMMKANYQQPMDFGDLAQKRIARELVELPMATNGFYLEVGSSAIEDNFTSFDFDGGNQPLAPSSPKFVALKTLAANFAGQVYDVENGRDRKTMRIRLLRMFHPRALPVLRELGEAYSKQFNRPLRVTSLTRSMDYQIALNKVNPNSFKVKGAGSLPPHTSGCAFDLGRKHMNAEEQNFVMAKLAEMENRGVLDALIEYNVNACFHVFIYPDGKPAK